jgi:hypothetical protein
MIIEMMSAYLPVQHIYKEIIQEEIRKNSSGKVFYFDAQDQVADAEGRITSLKEIAQGYFIEMDPAASIRIDRIITLFGKPGPAYDAYDAFANACMDCSGGDD